MASRCAEAESVWRCAMLLEVSGERLGRNASCVVFEPCARANRRGLPWRQFDLAKSSRQELSSSMSSSGGDVASACSPHTYSPHSYSLRSMGKCTRREAQRPRPEMALQLRAVVARLRDAERRQPKVVGRRLPLATVAQAQWKHVPLPHVPRAAGQGWPQRCKSQSLTFVEACWCVSLLCPPFLGLMPLYVYRVPREGQMLLCHSVRDHTAK